MIETEVPHRLRPVREYSAMERGYRRNGGVPSFRFAAGCTHRRGCWEPGQAEWMIQGLQGCMKAPVRAPKGAKP